MYRKLLSSKEIIQVWNTLKAAMGHLKTVQSECKHTKNKGVILINTYPP